MEIILSYKLFLIPLIVVVMAQFIKFCRFTLRYGLNWDYLFAPGHFPSAHSAFVSSLVVCIGYYESVTSGVFAVAACFAFITIYDAMRVRMHIGLQGKALNILVDKLDNIDLRSIPRLKERVGHYASEVIGGIAVGIVMSFVLIWVVEALYRVM